MKHETKQALSFFTNTMLMMAFFLLIFNAPVLIQTEFFTDDCGWGFVNKTFGGYYFEGDCK
jgi:hypothetical protein